MTTETPEEVLKKYFGYNSFRLKQSQIIQSVLAGQNVLAILPTGGGKSVCYQIPGLMMGGTTIVISPLISLMKDQVDQLLGRGISAAFLNSSLSETEQQTFFTTFTNGLYQFVYVSPERLLNKNFLNACTKVSIQFIAIDEAHCVSQWGHDFRPAYTQIPKFIHSLSSAPRLIALTATATQAVQKDILKHLEMDSSVIFQSSFSRKNLKLNCRFCHSEAEKQLWLFKLWRRFSEEKVIIYCATRAQTVEISQIARHYGYDCLYYHGGLAAEERVLIQQQFTSSQVKMIAATNAFGMGIDIPDIRVVIHTQVPQDLEGYYQEVGRAGRDGLESHCFLFYTKHDQQIQRELFLRRFPQTKDQIESSQQRKLRKNTQAKLNAVRNYLERNACRSNQILKYFGERATQNCQACDICIPEVFMLSKSENVRRQTILKKVTLQRPHFTRYFPGCISYSVVKYAALLPTLSVNDVSKIPGVGAGFLQAWAGYSQSRN